MTTLYKRGRGRKILVWSIKTEPTRFPTIVIEYGELNGKLVTDRNMVMEGKNIGKANETTIVNQAKIEVKSKIVKKQQEGYKSLDELGIIEDGIRDNSYNVISLGHYDSLYKALNAKLPETNTDASGNLKPMKAQPFWKEKKVKGVVTKVPRINFPCIGQPKINGVRCFAKWNFKTNKVELTSKLGLTYFLPHITNWLKNNVFDSEILKNELNPYTDTIEGTLDSLIFDGELFIKDEILSEIVAAIPRQIGDKSPSKANLNTDRVKYHIFDIAVPEIRQEERLDTLESIFQVLNNYHFTMPIVEVESCKITNVKEAESATKTWIKQGNEGGIFRDPNAMYEFGKRPMTMVKMKFRESSEFEILDVVPMENASHLGIFICKNDINNETFKVVPEGSHEIKQRYLDNKQDYIGKKLTVEFYERTAKPNELPFHAVGISIRDYE